jgi:hypothetical protein
MHPSGLAFMTRKSPPTALVQLAVVAAVLLAGGCAATRLEGPEEILDVHATDAAWPWLSAVQQCARDNGADVRLTSPQSAAVRLRLGEPDDLAGYAFQIGTDDVLIVAAANSTVPDLSPEAARLLFMGHANAAVSGWYMPAGEDIQVIVQQVILHGRPTSARATIAPDMLHIVRALNTDVGAIGVLTGRWKPTGMRQLSLVATVPVLAITPAQPKGTALTVITCLQEVA